MAVIPVFNNFRKYSPPVWFNGDGSVTVELKCAKVDDVQSATIEQVGLAPEKVKDANHDFIAKHVGKIEGLELEDGTKIETFKDVLENGPVELYNWITQAIYSTQKLTLAEVKN